jgi:hypothetical protein
MERGSIPNFTLLNRIASALHTTLTVSIPPAIGGTQPQLADHRAQLDRASCLLVADVNLRFVQLVSRHKPAVTAHLSHLSVEHVLGVAVGGLARPLYPDRPFHLGVSWILVLRKTVSSTTQRLGPVSRSPARPLGEERDRSSRTLPPRCVIGAGPSELLGGRTRSARRQVASATSPEKSTTVGDGREVASGQECHRVKPDLVGLGRLRARRYSSSSLPVEREPCSPHF